MKTCLLLLAGLLATAAALSPVASPPYPDRPGCTPGKSTFDGCNTCTCLSSRVISCTYRSCPPPPASCQNGQNFIDQCQNACICTSQGRYACKRRGIPGGGTCYDGGKTGEPMTCEVEGEIRIEAHTRLICKGGIVHFEYTDQPDRCTPGVAWKEKCNTCTCMDNGLHFGCTRKGCVPDEDPALNFGDVVVAIDSPCPKGLREGPHQFATKTCLGQDCTPGATWKVNRGCSTCVCTNDHEPACTPCKREPTASTVTCEGGLPSCPADCGRHYNAEEDCYECPCGVGEEGDTTVAAHDPCPPGTDVRAFGAFLKACAPLHKLPKGDTRLCDTLQCPEDCGTVRVSTVENCVYCQCGPELAPGDVEVPIDGKCYPPLFPGPTHLATKVCKAPTRQECRPGSQYNLECDTCICQDDGVPACTKRDCTQLCPYGPTFIDECDNVCRCGPHGYACTLKACRPGQTTAKPLSCSGAGKLPWLPDVRVYCHEGIVKIQSRAERCVPNSWSMDDENCNRCSCFGNGALACTLIGCIPLPQQCPYGPSFIDECTNVCRCKADGYACTRKACRRGQTTAKPLSCTGDIELPWVRDMRVYCHEGIVKIQSRDKPCVPDSWSMDDENCNTCNCGIYGEACTLMACIRNPDCPYGPTYIDECTNVCRCAGDGYGCTRKACRRGQTSAKPLSCTVGTKLPWVPDMRVYCHEGIVKMQSRDKHCVPNSWSMDEQNCNRCSCYDDGEEYCDRKACEPNPDGGY